MLTYSHAYYDLKNAILPLYDEGESSAIAHEILNFLTGLGRLQRLSEKDTPFTQEQQLRYNSIKKKLLNATPPQYIIGKTWFLGREFNVNEQVLIPRPETEELVQWIIDDAKQSNLNAPAILDIGTGSGCIPISLKLAISGANVTACDISAGALLVARSNADLHQVQINIQPLDFLDEPAREQLGNFDIIASNPPYIPFTQKDTLHRNVVDHEPHVALFVPGEEPLLFYVAIAEFGLKHLNKNGSIYCELDADHATEARQLFESKGYVDVEIRKDLSGKTRMIKAVLKK